jgi:two-component system chemotaxis response regulator CheB
VVEAHVSAIDAIVIGGSAGAVTTLGEILPRLPRDVPPVLIVVHVLPYTPSLLPEVFAPRCTMRVIEADPSLAIESGTIYFAPADYHLLVERSRVCALSIEAPVLFSRPSIDVLFESAAEAFGPRVAGVILTGASSDGAQGLRAIARQGGMTFVQDPKTAEARTMPEAALAAVPHARVLNVADLVASLVELTREET